MKASMYTGLLIAIVAVGCGKDSGGKAGGDKAGDDKAGGPPCSEAVGKYVELQLAGGGNQLVKFKDHPDRIKAVTALLEAHCTETWTAETKTCLAATTSDMKIRKCFKDAMDSARVAQVVFDYNKANPLPAADAPATGSGDPAPATP